MPDAIRRLRDENDALLLELSNELLRAARAISASQPGGSPFPPQYTAVAGRLREVYETSRKDPVSV